MVCPDPGTELEPEPELEYPEPEYPLPLPEYVNPGSEPVPCDVEPVVGVESVTGAVSLDDF